MSNNILWIYKLVALAFYNIMLFPGLHRKSNHILWWGKCLQNSTINSYTHLKHKNIKYTVKRALAWIYTDLISNSRLTCYVKWTSNFTSLCLRLFCFSHVHEENKPIPLRAAVRMSKIKKVRCLADACHYRCSTSGN